SIGCAGIGRPGEQYGMPLRTVLGQEDGREKPDTVPHGNVSLNLVIIVPDPGAVLAISLA
ncbi:MAG: hypothetical protein ACHP6H_04495, partial [Legionellales bacterium]